MFLVNHLRELVFAARALGHTDEVADAERELADLRASDPRFAGLDARLSAVLKGQSPKDNAERLALAQRAYDTKQHVVAVKLWGDALKADPNLADDRQVRHRYSAACAAALAAAAGSSQTAISPIKDAMRTAGNGAKAAERGVPQDTSRREDTSLIDGERSKLRKQAREWLEAELKTWTKLLAPANAQQRESIAKTLRHWQRDTELASVRDEAALAQLAEKERNEWKSLWANVDALLKKARTP
jgi:hypothetical protein